jgi:hypothetical protein
MTKAKLLLAVPIALLIALAALDAKWHLLVGALAWVLLRWGAGDVYRTLGRIRRWIYGLVVLCFLGAIFGRTDAQFHSFGWSISGTLAGVTMVVRAYAIVAITSLASAALPLRRWISRVSNPLLQRMLEVIVVAVNLVPVQVRALSTALTTLRERRPGLRNLPIRLWLLAVHCSLRAAMLAENVAVDIAIAAHNAGGKGKVTS